MARSCYAGVMTSLFHLTYISTAHEDVDVAACAAILEEARRRNAEGDVTGLLLYNGKRFLQVLEGSEPAVRETFARIEADPRHHALVVVGEGTVAEREFGGWAMAYDDGAGDSASLTAQVVTLLDRAGPSTRALFETSAQLYRRPL